MVSFVESKGILLGDYPFFENWMVIRFCQMIKEQCYMYSLKQISLHAESSRYVSPF
jgi:hypothetical protein